MGGPGIIDILAGAGRLSLEIVTNPVLPALHLLPEHGVREDQQRAWSCMGV
jgi:hypothetical protein